MDLERRTRTISEAAKILGLSRSTAFRLAKDGSLPTIKIGKRILIPLAALDRLLADPGTRTPASAPAA